jgi:hypothetical protein
VPAYPWAQVAIPELLTEIGPITLGTTSQKSQVLCDQFTGSGDTVTGVELKVPVATS